MASAKIKAYLIKNGITQADLAEKTDISAAVLSDIYAGQNKSISAVDYYKICSALGVSLDYILNV